MTAAKHSVRMLHARLAIITAFSAIIPFSGCANMPEVVPAGKDTFIVSHSGGIYTQNSGPIRADVFRAANDHCKQRGLVMVPVAVEERPYVLGRNTASVKLTFRALSQREAAEFD